VGQTSGSVASGPAKWGHFKTSGGEGFAKTKQHLFRAAISMSKERSGHSRHLLVMSF
jgi:hypothetical protein